MMKDEDKPSSRRLGRAGAFVAGVILLVIVLVFVGRNVWHAEELKHEEQTGEKERNGLN
ncbi:hypothetical protein WBP06_03295 [Novosphingobium sp. BL-8H]|uniref:hypothetical protein n=1 Tax=Novosphingobium sp. BL-8H TaxID=3127640 RepID=UPI003756C390